MGIDLSWEGEDGTPIKRVSDPEGCLSGLVQAADLRDTVCLRFVDAYGDTIFNQLQIPVLVDELERVMSTQVDPRIHGHLRLIFDLAKQARGQTHTYLKFVGD